MLDVGSHQPKYTTSTNNWRLGATNDCSPSKFFEDDSIREAVPASLCLLAGMRPAFTAQLLIFGGPTLDEDRDIRAIRDLA